MAKPKGPLPIKHPDFGKRFSLAMDKSGITAKHFQLTLNVSPEMVRRYRMGVSMPRDMAPIAQLLGVPPAWLSFGAGSAIEDEPTPVPSCNISGSTYWPFQRTSIEQIQALSPSQVAQLDIMLEGLLRGLSLDR